LAAPKGHEDTPEAGEHIGSPQREMIVLPQMIQWFKTMTTNAYLKRVKTEDWIPFQQRLW